MHSQQITSFRWESDWEKGTRARCALVGVVTYAVWILFFLRRYRIIHLKAHEGRTTNENHVPLYVPLVGQWVRRLASCSCS